MLLLREIYSWFTFIVTQTLQYMAQPLLHYTFFRHSYEDILFVTQIEFSTLLDTHQAFVMDAITSRTCH